jgi:putative DNA primase/helicase
VVTRPADLSKSRPPRWAWKRRVVMGSLNLLIGEEGIGKGTLIAHTIARWTTGQLAGDLCRKRVHVGILGDEDSWNDVWTPRLHAAGADLSRIHLIERRDGGYVDMRRDRRALTHQIERHHIRVLFLDQLLDNLGTGVDDWRQKAVREALQPFRSLASELDIALLGALHPNKRADTFRRLVAGSGAFNAVSRSSLLLAVHPDDDTRRVLVRGKGNLSAAPDTLTFAIKSYTFTANGESFSVPRACAWKHSDLTVQDLVTATERPQLAAQSKQGDARALIGQLLPKDGEWHTAKDVIASCLESGLDEKTVKRAKTTLGIEHRRANTFPTAFEWRWPSASEDTVRTHANGVPTVPTVPTAGVRSHGGSL